MSQKFWRAIEVFTPQGGLEIENPVLINTDLITRIGINNLGRCTIHFLNGQVIDCKYNGLEKAIDVSAKEIKELRRSCKSPDSSGER